LKSNWTQNYAVDKLALVHFLFMDFEKNSNPSLLRLTRTGTAKLVKDISSKVDAIFKEVWNEATVQAAKSTRASLSYQIQVEQENRIKFNLISSNKTLHPALFATIQSVCPYTQVLRWI
jgi:hypothetical protein